jgi:hypothetical protein
MPRKLFIVAWGNEAVYGQLHRTVGREPGVQIIYDRRRPPKKRGKLRRAASGVTGMLGGGRRAHEALGRRQRDVAEELRTKGWAVVHLDDQDDT